FKPGPAGNARIILLAGRIDTSPERQRRDGPLASARGLWPNLPRGVYLADPHPAQQRGLRTFSLRFRLSLLAALIDALHKVFFRLHVEAEHSVPGPRRTEPAARADGIACFLQLPLQSACGLHVKDTLTSQIDID